MSGLKTLKKRREGGCKNFALKLAKSSKFGDLFPKNEYDTDAPALRRTKEYKETFARTERMYRSPLYHMRRLLNE